jgi:hypothetical protein
MSRNQKLVVYVDVDDTLIRSVGTKRIPLPRVIEHVRQLHVEGAELNCWSSGGALYAREIATELGIETLFVNFLSKPNVLLDDQFVADWRMTVQIHPAEVSTTDAYVAQIANKPALTR